MSYWILKTEPTAYSYDRLEKEKTAVWDGVANPVALKNLKAMAKGDELMIYHTGAEKSVIGTASVAKEAYPDPKAGNPSMVVIDIKVGKRLAKPVTLAQIKADSTFAEMALVRQGRLSVVPATA
ncbi:MAG TPA: EVE domain-containing protein, partial [Gemmatimonadales bacterium]|nr:EVE domain-containing protein [Gemmatimonadales bacterium]